MANKAKLVLTLTVDSREHAEKLASAINDAVNDLTAGDFERLHSLLMAYNVKLESGRINS